QYRAAGTVNWQEFGNYNVRGTNNKSQRASYAIDVPEGQYDVRVRVAGNNTDGSGAEASFVWTTLTSVQRDTASYAGIPRIGIRMQANGQLNGAPDEIRCIAHSMPIPVWTGTVWVTQRTSNAGAWILAYARGIYAPDPTAPGGRALVAGMGLPERQIDLEGLKAFMLHCAANNFTYNNWITDVRSHQQVLDVLALAGFGQISWPRGRLSVGWAADEQPLSGVVNMANIKKGQFQVDYTLTNGADGIEYTYLDSATWQSKTLRVPAPGVTTMLNPAQVSGEGVTTEAHAVMLARWHLAQSLYQYKAISYSTDIEHLSYSRMSMLALQHDMTQWGFGGRVKGASIAGGRATLQLDEPVPAPAQGNAFVGLRIPGERVYRVLRVQPFAGTSDTLVLADGWPADAALPGNSEANP
ncbi:carbohydrate-binding protein, partial [Stenotrophomonas sp. Betaine-02u-21]|uniref:host specificity factor TipJ family phage tail protein n=2 Tax=Stenotrophomonas TaxID=40323 RepID=UPI000CC1E48A